MRATMPFDRVMQRVTFRFGRLAVEIVRSEHVHVHQLRVSDELERDVSDLVQRVRGEAAFLQQLS